MLDAVLVEQFLERRTLHAVKLVGAALVGAAGFEPATVNDQVIPPGL